MSARMPFEGRPSAADRALQAAQARRDAQREDELRRLHERLDSLLFWVVTLMAVAAIGLQIGWAP